MLSKIKTILTHPFLTMVVLPLTVLILVIKHQSSLPVNRQGSDMANHSVSILSKRGGGSGVILTSTSKGSTILTNAHVCELLKDGNGRVVTHENKVYYPTEFSLSKIHDICVVTVKEDLGIETDLAETGPDKMNVTRAIGHPKLLPTTISEGHYAGQTRIQVMTGITECTDADLENPETAFICMLAGGMPVIQTYTADIHTSLISGGSSGSPVYNTANEIVGLVFAGSGTMSEAYVVPVEFIHQTLDRNLLTKGVIKDTTTYAEMLNGSAKPRVQRSEALIKIKLACNDVNNRAKLGKICRFADRNTLFVNEAD